MKHLYIAVLLLIISQSTFSQTYRIYTANASGNFSAPGIWTSVVRVDGVSKNKYIIPAIPVYNITAISAFDYTALGDIELVVHGTLTLASGTFFNLTQNSTIAVTGTLKTLGASVVAIGSSWKFLTFGTVNMVGPLYTDFTTTGFAASILSVRFLNFTASLQYDHTALLNWSTSEENNNSHFEIESSTNNNDWTSVGSVPALDKNNTINKYSFNHRNVTASITAYRLKQVNKDGKFDYSSVVMVRQSNANLADISTVNKIVNIAFNSEQKGNVVVSILRMNGQIAMTQTYNRPSGKIAVNASQLSNGRYFIHVRDNNSNGQVKNVLLN